MLFYKDLKELNSHVNTNTMDSEDKFILIDQEQMKGKTA